MGWVSYITVVNTLQKYLHVRTEEMRQVVSRLRETIILISILFFLMTLTLSTLVSVKFTEPIQKLIKEIKNFQDDKIKVSFEPSCMKEVQYLFDCFT